MKVKKDYLMTTDMRKFDTTLSREDTLTISELDKSNSKDIWVINSTSGNTCGVVQFQVMNNQGTHINIEVPYTFVAVNLANFSAPANIINSDAFRRAVNRRMLTIVTDDYAEILNSSPEAQIELETISRGVSVGAAENAETLLGGGDLKSNRKVQVNLPTTAGINEDDDESNDELKINPVILSVMRNSSTSSMEKVNQLRTHRKLLKPVDAYYIHASATLADDEDADDLIQASSKMISQFKTRYSKDDMKEARRAARRWVEGS